MTKRTTVIICACVVVAAGAILWWQPWHSHTGLLEPNKAGGRRAKSHDPLQPAVDAYNKGDYSGAEAAANRILKTSAGSKDQKKHRKAVEARYLLAFAAARRKNMPQARDRFAVLQSEASKLPDKGAQAPLPGVIRPTLEQEAAYEHAVCTAAMGDKKAAEAEYFAFLRSYPDSPLIDAAVGRIKLLHGGHTVPAAEAAWKQAKAIGQKREAARQQAQNRAMSACGPECLAEFLRRFGKTANEDALAKELRTSFQGTSMLSMVQVAKKHGLDGKGMRLSFEALPKQPLPLIALLRPGHYVIVQKVTKDVVTTWDPSGRGLGKPGIRDYKLRHWLPAWSGVAMVIQGKH